ncbi:unnamed protein product [Chironomus riparius]|uniref:Uncharacterized protein n=1 Tax=Chironomus riparius TaxID=315576 RepID=A0A9P0IZA1_9DIPT|nr:unnamed protein product [Chironomus riparius]
MLLVSHFSIKSLCKWTSFLGLKMKLLIFVNICFAISVAFCNESNENNVNVIDKVEARSTTESSLSEQNHASSMSPTSPQPTLQPTKKRKIFYINQQQSGKFNVHLEFNDVSLVVIPKAKDPQLSLLNLLLESAKKSNIKLNEEKKKEEITKVNGHNEDDYSKYKMDNYIHTSTIEPSIESRAPYHVDISSTLASTQPILNIQPKSSNNAQITSDITRIPLLKILKPIPIAIQMPQTIKKIAKRSIDTSFLGYDSNVLGDTNIPDESEDERDLINTIENSDNVNELSNDHIEHYKTEFTLLGAAENCGPGRSRNSYQVCVPVTE